MNKEEAKVLSLKRWRAIRKDYKHIHINFGSHPDSAVYEECGFCQLHTDNFLDILCEECELFPTTCSNTPNGSIYWTIVRQLKTGSTKGLYSLLNRMIKAIKEA
jgi:hypothetical protein